jgi:hypothetical protein
MIYRFDPFDEPEWASEARDKRARKRREKRKASRARKAAQAERDRDKKLLQEHLSKDHI